MPLPCLTVLYGGYLLLGGRMLLIRYPEGDCDRISWPNPDLPALARALYDEYEMGNLDSRIVLLPYATEFNIDEHVT